MIERLEYHIFQAWFISVVTPFPLKNSQITPTKSWTVNWYPLKKGPFYKEMNHLNPNINFQGRYSSFCMGDLHVNLKKKKPQDLVQKNEKLRVFQAVIYRVYMYNSTRGPHWPWLSLPDIDRVMFERFIFPFRMRIPDSHQDDVEPTFLGSGNPEPSFLVTGILCVGGGTPWKFHGPSLRFKFISINLKILYTPKKQDNPVAVFFDWIPGSYGFSQVDPSHLHFSFPPKKKRHVHLFGANFFRPNAPGLSSWTSEGRNQPLPDMWTYVLPSNRSPATIWNGCGRVSLIPKKKVWRL